MHGAYLIQISYKYNFLQELENLQICLYIYPDGADNDKPSQTCLFWILQIVVPLCPIRSRTTDLIHPGASTLISAPRSKQLGHQGSSVFK